MLIPRVLQWMLMPMVELLRCYPTLITIYQYFQYIESSLFTILKTVNKFIVVKLNTKNLAIYFQYIESSLLSTTAINMQKSAKSWVWNFSFLKLDRNKTFPYWWNNILKFDQVWGWVFRWFYPTNPLDMWLGISTLQTHSQLYTNAFVELLFFLLWLL